MCIRDRSTTSLCLSVPFGTRKAGDEYGEVDGSMTCCSMSLLIWFLIMSILGGDNLYGCRRITLCSLKFILYSIRLVNPNLGVSTVENSLINFWILCRSFPFKWLKLDSWCSNWIVEVSQFLLLFSSVSNWYFRVRSNLKQYCLAYMLRIKPGLLIKSAPSIKFCPKTSAMSSVTYQVKFFIFNLTVIPVSYTHLDVYKRQT